MTSPLSSRVTLPLSMTNTEAQRLELMQTVPNFCSAWRRRKKKDIGTFERNLSFVKLGRSIGSQID